MHARENCNESSDGGMVGEGGGGRREELPRVFFDLHPPPPPKTIQLQTTCMSFGIVVALKLSGE